MFKFMNRKAIRVFYLMVGLTLSIGMVNNASATILKDRKGLAWASHRDLTSSQFSSKFKQYSDQGMMMIDVDAYKVGNSLRYSMVWRENTDNRAWAEHRNLSSSAYYAKWKYYRDRGYRPLDIAAYKSGKSTLFAGIWVKNTEGIGWSSYRNLTSKRYGEIFTERSKAGYRLVDMEVYETSSGLRYTAIWYRNSDRRSWAQLRNMSRDQYQKEVNERSKKGYMVVDYETYKNGKKRQYAAIWEKKPGYAREVRTNRSATEFANLWREYRDKGYRLIDFERYGNDYGGIWIENNSRYRYSRKSQLDNRIIEYRNDNDLPGISVSIIRNGTTIYRRGFGFADVGKKKVAHSQTVYNSASVAKVLGGTLAAKLESEQTLKNGARFNLDLSDRTSDYLDDMPSHHTHTVEQLFSHLGCVAHYTSTPKISNQTKHYTNAKDAVESIWKTGLRNNCTIGTSNRYSTAAFTFAAAVMEHATGRTINQLLHNELFTPHDLNMRVQFSSSKLPSNYERAVPYNDKNNKTSYQNNSWKVIGGGIESSAYELARFGWKVLDGEIIDATTRDNRLWQRVNPARTNGLAWYVKTSGGRRVAEHGGSWTGARSFIRVYRDDGLVIAIMSNRNEHDVDDVDGLATDLANIVL